MGIGLSEGVGKGSNVYDVIVGTRTFPIVEKPLLAAGGPGVVKDGGSEDEDPGNVDEGFGGGEEDRDGRGRDPTLLAGGLVADERGLELWASALPRRVNKEHSVERKDTRSMVWEEGVLENGQSMRGDFICKSGTHPRFANAHSQLFAAWH